MFLNILTVLFYSVQVLTMPDFQRRDSYETDTRFQKHKHTDTSELHNQPIKQIQRKVNRGVNSAP
jgi:hypothetical protein